MYLIIHGWYRVSRSFTPTTFRGLIINSNASQFFALFWQCCSSKSSLSLSISLSISLPLALFSCLSLTLSLSLLLFLSPRMCFHRNGMNSLSTDWTSHCRHPRFRCPSADASIQPAATEQKDNSIMIQPSHHLPIQNLQYHNASL